jgi:hypothetical protein
MCEPELILKIIRYDNVQQQEPDSAFGERRWTASAPIPLGRAKRSDSGIVACELSVEFRFYRPFSENPFHGAFFNVDCDPANTAAGSVSGKTVGVD